MNVMLINNNNHQHKVIEEFISCHNYYIKIDRTDGVGEGLTRQPGVSRACLVWCRLLSLFSINVNIIFAYLFKKIII